jgi:hypothetical protein
MGIQSLEIRSCHDTRTGYFYVERMEAADFASTFEQVDGGELVRRRVRMRLRTEARLIGDELDVAGRDLLYEQSLGKLAGATAPPPRAG